MIYSTYVGTDLINKYGSTASIELPPSSIKYDPRSGLQVSRRFAGSYDDMIAISNGFQVSKIAHEINPSSDGTNYWYLTTNNAATDAGGQTVPDADTIIQSKFDVDANEVNTPLWAHPRVAAASGSMFALATYDEALRRFCWVKQAIEKAAAGEYTMPHPRYKDGTTGYETSSMDIPLADILVIANEWGANTGSLQQVVRLLRNGVESYLDKPQYVLRIDRVVPLDTNLRPTATYINRLFLPDALSTYESVPASVASSLPATGYWLKKSPTLNQTSIDKLTIHFEYWHSDNYEMFLYDTPITVGDL